MPALRALPPRPAHLAVAVGFAIAGCLAGAYYHPAPWQPFDVRAYLLTVLIALPLALREKRPFPVLVITAGGFTAYLLLGYQPSLNFWSPAVAFVSVAAVERRRRAGSGAVVLAAVIALSGVCGRLPWPVVVVQAVIVPAVAATVGLTQRRLAQRNAELRRLTALLGQQQRQEARRAVLDERFRIARELHDTISQHMTIATLQTGIAEYTFHADPAAARTALGVAATAGRDALDELRRLLIVLRTHDVTGADEGPSARGDAGDREDPAAPVPDELLAGIDRIPALAEHLEVTGLRVTVRFLGEPRPLHPGVELCAYRVVQEALTNVVKHAEAAAAEVTVEYREHELDVTVLDQGGPAPGTRAAPTRTAGGPVRQAARSAGSGHGLIGMRERAKIWHGTLTAGARPEGGFEVRLRLPLGQQLPGEHHPPRPDRSSG
ncbi:sensor histidine kinase [Streptomyces longwoodensis]|uniref:sensor histidine kinase n=1 Tax=Streptomyces longwoodensis TaxID=68231 RepID=UPI0036FB9056